MNGLIALSLALLLGQTSSSPLTSTASDSSSDDVGFGGSGSVQDTTAQGQAAATQLQELEQLQAQVKALQAQLQTQQQLDQQVQGRLQDLEQQQALAEQQQAARQAASQRLELLRVQRLNNLERGYQWLVTASQQLEVGELTVGPALDSARDELSGAFSSAAETGHGEAAGLIQSALNRVADITTLVEQRDLYRARLQLQDAGLELRSAWDMSTNRSGATLVSP